MRKTCQGQLDSLFLHIFYVFWNVDVTTVDNIPKQVIEPMPRLAWYASLLKLIYSVVAMTNGSNFICRILKEWQHFKKVFWAWAIFSVKMNYVCSASYKRTPYVWKQLSSEWKTFWLEKIVGSAIILLIVGGTCHFFCLSPLLKKTLLLFQSPPYFNIDKGGSREWLGK